MTYFTTATRPVAYSVGDIITYDASGGIRVVRVTAKYEEVKNGEPGFDAILLDAAYRPIRSQHDDDWSRVWGYDSQVTGVELRGDGFQCGVDVGYNTACGDDAADLGSDGFPQCRHHLEFDRWAASQPEEEFDAAYEAWSAQWETEHRAECRDPWCSCKDGE